MADFDILAANELYLKGDYVAALKAYRDLSDVSVDCRRMAAWLEFDLAKTGDDLRRSVELFRSCAEEGDPEAQFGLGKALIRLGDEADGVSSLLAAWDAGCIAAAYRLGQFYELRREESESIVEALRWYRRGASMGHILSAQRERYLLLRGCGGLMGYVVLPVRLTQLLTLGISVARSDSLQDPRKLS